MKITCPESADDVPPEDVGIICWAITGVCIIDDGLIIGCPTAVCNVAIVTVLGVVVDTAVVDDELVGMP